jgi:hypothetical protein
MAFTHIIRASGNTPAINLTPVPAARDNYLCIADYPRYLYAESYVYAENATEYDIYDLTTLPATLSVRVNSVTVKALVAKENDAAAGTAELVLEIDGNLHYSGTAETLTTSWAEISHTWTVNPETDDFWSISDINDLEAGIRLISAAAGTEARCTQLYIDAQLSLIGLKAAPSINSISSNHIPVSSDFSVILPLPSAIDIYETGNTIEIIAKLPDGSTSDLSAVIIDSAYLLATIPAATASSAGKYQFRGKITFASGDIMQTDPISINVREPWA